MNAIDPKYDSMGDFELVDELSKIGNVKVPNAIEEIRNAEIRHNNLCEVAGMKDIVKKFLECNEYKEDKYKLWHSACFKALCSQLFLSS